MLEHLPTKDVNAHRGQERPSGGLFSGEPQRCGIDPHLFQALTGGFFSEIGYSSALVDFEQTESGRGGGGGDRNRDVRSGFEVAFYESFVIHPVEIISG